MTLDVLYKPTAAAAEYSRGYALNLRTTCRGECRYCSAPLTLHKTREDYHIPGPVKKDLISRLERDLAKIGKQEDPIFMSFIGDPCEVHVQEDYDLLRHALELIYLSGNRVRLLTKQSISEFSLPGKQGFAEFGETLTTRDVASRDVWERGTISAHVRLGNLYRFHESGYLTWASFEPVINPDFTLELIERAAPYCDVFAVGCSNHLGNWDWPSPEKEARVRAIDWQWFLGIARCLCERLGKVAYFKRDLIRAAKADPIAFPFHSLDAAIDAAKERRIR